MVEVMTVGPRMAVDTVPKQCESGRLQITSIKAILKVPEEIRRHFQFILGENVGSSPSLPTIRVRLCRVFFSLEQRSDRILFHQNTRGGNVLIQPVELKPCTVCSLGNEDSS